MVRQLPIPRPLPLESQKKHRIIIYLAAYIDEMEANNVTAYVFHLVC